MTPERKGGLGMRIVYIHQYYCHPGMTGGIRSYEQARRLVARGSPRDGPSAGSI